MSTPIEFAAYHRLGLLRAQQGRFSEALTSLSVALSIDPGSADALSDHGDVLSALGRHEQALASYGKALAIQPHKLPAIHGRGNAHFALRQFAQALENYDLALSLNPDDAISLYNRACALREQGRLEEALTGFDSALARNPSDVETVTSRAGVLQKLGRLDEALAGYDQALQIQPRFIEALNNRSIIFSRQGRWRAAMQDCEAILKLVPRHAEALNNRGIALQNMQRPDEALDHFGAALSARPGYADALFNRGNTLLELGKPSEALGDFEQALAAAPDHPNALSGLANAAMTIGDWTRTARLADVLKNDVLAGMTVIQPFVLMGYWDDNELQLRCAQNFVRQTGLGPMPPLWKGERYDHDKIRVAYLSADFHRHVTAALTVEMFERHDRERFEITAISFGPDDGSAMRRRLIRAFDRFHDARLQTDREVASLLQQWEIDIAVDLGGHTSGARPWVLAHRPAPVQVKYMGYPGTSGSDFIDAIIADRIVVPPDQDRFFSEKITVMPDTLWVTDTVNPVQPPPSRAECGLPENAFVFCCFNHNWKITAPLFDIWMRLLNQVEGSVLWLLQGNDAIRANLRREAQARGIDPDRIVFAARTTPELHLARQRVADLFLDTLPYNAHTTASDALWAGLPVVTTPGRSFPARVAASILTAAGLPELIAPDLERYEALALTLATDRGALDAVKEKLARNRQTNPLFDTARFTRNLEAAYAALLERV